MKKVMTVAGSDSGGGAGIQADLKTFAAWRVFGTSAITALTAQNSCRVKAVHAVPAEFVAAQMEAVIEDIGVDALKTGMLPNAAAIRTVAGVLRRCQITPLVVDPVMVAQSGDRLMEQEALGALKEDLLPMAALVTPNLDEAELLTGEPVGDLAGMERAARSILAMGASWVLVKGGHLAGAEVVDLLLGSNSMHLYWSPRIKTSNNHGTGCTYAAAITAALALGMKMPEAVAEARRYLLQALTRGLQVGRGSGPVHHLVRYYQEWP